MDIALAATSPPSLPHTSVGSSPGKEVKRAKTLDVDGVVKRDVTQHEKRVESPLRSSHVKQGVPFRDTVMGDRLGNTSGFDEEYIVSNDSDDEGEDDPTCPTTRVSKEEKVWVRRKWSCSLILRTLGKSFSHAFMTRRLQALWALDIHQPIISKYRLHRRVRRVEYEGLHEICFHCGRYGHNKDSCLDLRPVEDVGIGETLTTNSIFSAEPLRPELVEEYGPWMQAPGARPSTKETAGAKGSRFTVLDEVELERPTPQRSFLLRIYMLPRRSLLRVLRVARRLTEN
ncbi:hypothetical protein LINPERHAP1_LOCUS22199 [Linum perenne]